MGRTLILVGLLLVVAGLVVLGVERLLGSGARGLPGDVVIRRGNWTIYFPIMTSIVISVLLTAILWLVGWFSRR